MRQVKGRRGVTYNASRAAFWYIVVADCALEFYDAKPPPLHFDITIKNNGQHLPSDLSGIGWVYVTNFLFMFFLGLVFVSMAVRMHRKNEKTTHLVVLLVMLAYFLQMMSLLLELLHLRRFVKDGKGLRWRYSYLPADFMAEVSQGTSEFITTMTLLFLVCGWTTTAEAESLKSSAAKVFSGDSSLESGSAARRRTGRILEPSQARTASQTMGNEREDVRTTLVAMVITTTMRRRRMRRQRRKQSLKVRQPSRKVCSVKKRWKIQRRNEF